MTLLELMQRAREAPAASSLDALARAASADPDGRPSDAVREYLRVHPARATARGELLARARAVMLDSPGKAHLPAVPTRIARRDAAAYGYPQLRSDREPWLSTPLLAMEAFSGGGLFSLASALEGNIEVDDCEWSTAAVATRAANKGLLRLAFDPVPKDARAWRPSTRTPDGLDLLFGGPPCSPFSKGADLGRDKRDRGWLAADNFFPLALDWMVDLQPRVVAWENAPTLVERPEYVRWLAAWRAQARVAGYETAVHLLASADFGNPTMRRRAFVFAWPIGAAWGAALSTAPVTTHARPGSLSVTRGDKLPWVPMLDRLVGGCCGGWGLVDCVSLGGLDAECRGCGNAKNFRPAPNTGGDHGRRGMKGVLVETERGGSKPWHAWIRDTVGERQRRFDKFTPADSAGAWVPIGAKARDLAIGAGQRVSEYLSRTVVPGFSNKAEGLLIPPEATPGAHGETRDWQKETLEQLQGMSVRDAAKLQDVPQWYGFSGTRTDAFNQVGMGVPVNLGRGVIAHVRKALGLSVRRPWWETSVPVVPRAVRFETREDIARQRPGSLRAGTGSGMPDGLWPTESMDACFAVPPMLQHGLVLNEWVEDDWAELLSMGEIGVEAQRREGRSPLDRDLHLPAHGAARTQTLEGGRRARTLFDPETGLNREALWHAGYRGPPFAAPEDMPFAFEFDVDAAAEWSDALRYSDGGPWSSVLGLYLRLRYPVAMYDAADDASWWTLFTIEADLPKRLDAATRSAFTDAGLPVPTPDLLEQARASDARASRKAGR